MAAVLIGDRKIPLRHVAIGVTALCASLGSFKLLRYLYGRKSSLSNQDPLRNVAGSGGTQSRNRYKNPRLGLSFESPPELRFRSDNRLFPIAMLEFDFPGLSDDDSRLIITVEECDADMTLEEYKDRAIEQVVEQLSSELSRVEVCTPRPSYLSGCPAYEMVYSHSTDAGRRKVWCLLTMFQGRAYCLQFNASIASLNAAERFRDVAASLRLHNPKSSVPPSNLLFTDPTLAVSFLLSPRYFYNRRRLPSPWLQMPEPDQHDASSALTSRRPLRFVAPPCPQRGVTASSIMQISLLDSASPTATLDMKTTLDVRCDAYQRLVQSTLPRHSSLRWGRRLFRTVTVGTFRRLGSEAGRTGSDISSSAFSAFSGSQMASSSVHGSSLINQSGTAATASGVSTAGLTSSLNDHDDQHHTVEVAVVFYDVTSANSSSEPDLMSPVPLAAAPPAPASSPHSLSSGPSPFGVRKVAVAPQSHVVPHPLGSAGDDSAADMMISFLDLGASSAIDHMTGGASSTAPLADSFLFLSHADVESPHVRQSSTASSSTTTTSSTAAGASTPANIKTFPSTSVSPTTTSTGFYKGLASRRKPPTTSTSPPPPLSPVARAAAPPRKPTVTNPTLTNTSLASALSPATLYHVAVVALHISSYAIIFAGATNDASYLNVVESDLVSTAASVTVVDEPDVQRMPEPVLTYFSEEAGFKVNVPATFRAIEPVVADPHVRFVDASGPIPDLNPPVPRHPHSGIGTHGGVGEPYRPRSPEDSLSNSSNNGHYVFVGGGSSPLRSGIIPAVAFPPEEGVIIGSDPEQGAMADISIQVRIDAHGLEATLQSVVSEYLAKTQRYLDGILELEEQNDCVVPVISLRKDQTLLSSMASSLASSISAPLSQEEVPAMLTTFTHQQINDEDAVVKFLVLAALREGHSYLLETSCPLSQYTKHVTLFNQVVASFALLHSDTAASPSPRASPNTFSPSYA